MTNFLTSKGKYH